MMPYFRREFAFNLPTETALEALKIPENMGKLHTHLSASDLASNGFILTTESQISGMSLPGAMEEVTFNSDKCFSR